MKKMLRCFTFSAGRSLVNLSILIEKILRCAAPIQQHSARMEPHLKNGVPVGCGRGLVLHTFFSFRVVSCAILCLVIQEWHTISIIHKC